MLKQVKGWVQGLADLGVSFLALAIVLEILFKGAAVPFMPATSVVGNVTAIVGTLGAQGLVGLVALWVLYTIWKNR